MIMPAPGVGRDDSARRLLRAVSKRRAGVVAPYKMDPNSGRS